MIKMTLESIDALPFLRKHYLAVTREPEIFEQDLQIFYIIIGSLAAAFVISIIISCVTVKVMKKRMTRKLKAEIIAKEIEIGKKLCLYILLRISKLMFTS